MGGGGADMTTRTASCSCGQLALECRGEPVRVSVCHCLDCQRRSGSAFAVQARWPEEDIASTGTVSYWTKRSEAGSSATFGFCPECGVTAFYRLDSMPGLVAVPVGTFVDPQFPVPEYSIFEDRMHHWLSIDAEGLEHYP
jgi:hypothetical protein